MAGNNNRDKKGEELVRRLEKLTAKVKKYRSSEKKLAKRQTRIEHDHLGFARQLHTLERQSAALGEGMDALRRGWQGVQDAAEQGLGDGGVALGERLARLEQRLGGESAARQELAGAAERLRQQDSERAALVALLEQRLTALASDIERVASQVVSSGHAADASGSQSPSDVAGLRPDIVGGELEQLHTLAESQGQIIAGLGSRVDLLEQAVAELEDRSRRIGVAVDALEGRSEGLEQRLEQDIAAEGQALSATQHGIESQARVTSEHLQSLENSQSGLSDELRALAARQDGLDSDLAEAGNQIRYLSGVLDQLSASGGPFGADSGGAAVDRESQQALAAKLEAGYAGIQQQLDSHSAFTEMLARKLELLSQAQAGPASAKEEDPALPRLTQGLRDLQDQLAAVADREQALARRVEELSRSSAETFSASSAEIDQLRVELGNIQQGLDGFGALEQDLRQGFAGLQSSTRAIAESGGKQQETLARIDAALRSVQSEIEASRTRHQGLEARLGALADGYQQSLRSSTLQGEQLQHLTTDTGKLRDALQKTARFSQGVQRQLERSAEPTQQLRESVGRLGLRLDRTQTDVRHLAARSRRWIGGILALSLVLLLGGGIGAWAWWSQGRGAEQTALRDRVDALERTARAQAVELGDVHALAQQLEIGRIERTEHSLDLLQDAVAALGETANGNRAGLASVEQSQRAAAETMQHMQGDVQALGAALEAMEQQRDQAQQRRERPKEALGEQSTGGPAGVLDSEIRGVAWLRERAPRRFTIQVAGAYTEGTVEAIARRQELSGPLAVYGRESDGQVWHVLLFGDFATKTEALAALDTLPPPVQALGPFLRLFRSVQRELPAGGAIEP